jgi:hypothetical protein
MDGRLETKNKYEKIPNICAEEHGDRMSMQVAEDASLLSDTQ